MIKYLGSKRRLVPVLARLCEAAGARTALDLFTGTTRVAQAFKHTGAHVTAVDTARYSEVFARTYVETDARDVDLAELAAVIDDLNARPGAPGYFTETFCEQSRFFQPFNGARVDAIRDAIEREHAGTPYHPILLTSLLEAADRVDSTTGVQMAYVKEWAPRSALPLTLRVPGAAPRRRCVGPRRRARGRPHAAAVRSRLPRPALQPAPLLHELPRVGDARRVGRARALRRRVQADRRARRRDQERVQPSAAHARRAARR